MKFENPRTPCGSVSSKRNKYVGGEFTMKGVRRRVIGCAKVGDDEGYFATRKPGSTGTRYTPVKKRALRDLKSRRPKAVKVGKHKGVKRTSAALVSSFEKRYAKAAKPAKRARKGKLTGAAKAEFLRKRAAGRKRAGR
jgi:hypothetical protein